MESQWSYSTENWAGGLGKKWAHKILKVPVNSVIRTKARLLAKHIRLIGFGNLQVVEFLYIAHSHRKYTEISIYLLSMCLPMCTYTALPLNLKQQCIIISHGSVGWLDSIGWSQLVSPMKLHLDNWCWSHQNIRHSRWFEKWPHSLFLYFNSG